MKNRFRQYITFALLVIFLLFFIQFIIVAPSMDWTWRLVREIEYPIPYFGMLGSILAIGGVVIWDIKSEK